MDDRGNVIFYGDLDYLGLMKGILPCLEGTDKILNENYKSLSKISKIDSEKVFHNFINEKRNIVSVDIDGIENYKLLWYLRKF